MRTAMGLVLGIMTGMLFIWVILNFGLMMTASKVASVVVTLILAGATAALLSQQRSR